MTRSSAPSKKTDPIREGEIHREWDQLADENDRAYRAFLSYLLLSSRRSIRKAWAVYKRRLSSKPPGYFRDWCAKYRWLDRAAAFDKQMAEKRRTADEERRALLASLHEPETQPEASTLNVRFVIDPETGEPVLQFGSEPNKWVSIPEAHRTHPNASLTLLMREARAQPRRRIRG